MTPNFAKLFDINKTRMIGLPWCEKNYNKIHFNTIQEHNGRTDRRTDRIAISISRVSTLTRDKNAVATYTYFLFVSKPSAVGQPTRPTQPFINVV